MHPSEASRTQLMPAWKRAIDIGCCLIALPFCALLTVVVAAWFSLFSFGPVFFRQERVGLGRRLFHCYKFRTMVVRADSGIHRAHLAKLIGTNAPMQKIEAEHDARLVPMGRVLRATGLDELPQIFNILQGEMSIVGPRPCIPYETENYLPWQMERFDAVPGLTGLWQVSGKNRTTFEEMIHLDIKYARSKTWALDLRIIALTVPTIIVELYRSQLSPRTTSVQGAQTSPSATARHAGSPESGRGRPNRAAPVSSF